MAVAAIILLMQFAAVFSAIPQVQKCQLRDSNCIKSSAQSFVPALSSGIPEVEAQPLDPMTVDKIDVDLAGLKLNIRDAEVTGLKNTIIDQISLDMAKKQMKLVYHADLVLKGKYKASGRLLILPITGDGQTTIKLKNCQISIDMLFDVTKNSEGKDFIDLKTYKYNYDVKDNAHFHLSNLFNGNKEASDTMHTFMNSSWKLLTQEFGTPMFNKPVEKIFNSIKAYLKSQPLENIANI